MKLAIKATLKYSIMIIISGFAFISVNAQEKNKKIEKIYFNAGGGPATKKGGYSDLGVLVVLKNKWTAGISIQNVETVPKNLPSNYERGYGLALIIPFTDPYPSFKMPVISLTAGRYHSISRKIWLTTEAGLSFVKGKEMSFQSQPVDHDIFYTSSNYSYTSGESKSSIGATIKADFNWAVTPYIGLGAGVFANFNGIQSPIGFQFKAIAGFLNSKKNKRKEFTF